MKIKMVETRWMNNMNLTETTKVLLHTQPNLQEILLCKQGGRKLANLQSDHTMEKGAYGVVPRNVSPED